MPATHNKHNSIVLFHFLIDRNENFFLINLSAFKNWFCFYLHIQLATIYFVFNIF